MCVGVKCGWVGVVSVLQAEACNTNTTLWTEGVKPVEIHRRMLAQYGQSTMSQRKVYELVERFKSDRTHVTDESRSGRPSTSRAQDHKSSRKASSPQEYRN